MMSITKCAPLSRRASETTTCFELVDQVSPSRSTQGKHSYGAVNNRIAPPTPIVLHPPRKIAAGYPDFCG